MNYTVDHGLRTVKVRIYGTDEVVAELPAGDAARICREIVAGLPEAERVRLIKDVAWDAEPLGRRRQYNAPF